MREEYNPFLGDSSSQDAPQRLPTNVKPTHYDIRLEPDLENASFTGLVTIHLNILKHTTSILLNAVDLDILTTHLILPDATFLIRKIYYDESQQTILVPLPGMIGGSIKLQQTFKGRLNDAKMMAGFMRSRYKDVDGKERWIASTQGQPTGIRQIFPCADEPGLKATFSATLIVDQGLTCLSNMDVASSHSRPNGKKTVVFNKTPLMSTYLVAFVVGELNFIESNEFRVPVRVYAPPDQDIKDGKLALDIGAKAMIAHENTFGTPYPLPKLDMVAIPGHAGGMENWGCVIYDDKYLIHSPSDLSAADVQRTASIIIHELAHQWFGNIVTAEWWDSIWLNESFADWATFNAISNMYPEWDSWTNFVAEGGGFNAYQAALALDSNRGSHAIEVPVDTAEQISQIFDAITYAKGCSVLRMIAEFLGVEVFIEGVRLHLKRHAFANATTSDLWDSLSTVSGKDVENIMSTWTSKVGYPILSITEDESTNSISITQHRFLQSGSPLPEEDQVLYPIYLKPRTHQGIDNESHLFTRTIKFPINLKFYKLNASQTGLYRVSYPPSRLQALSHQLPLLSPSDRVGLLSDVLSIAKSGSSSPLTSTFLTFLLSFRNETNYFVWRQLLSCLAEIRQAWIFEDARTLSALSNLQSSLMAPILKKLGNGLWNFEKGESYTSQNFKAVLFDNAASCYPPVKKIANKLFERFVEEEDKTSTLDPNIRQAVFDIVLSENEEEELEDKYNSLLAIFHTSASLTLRSQALNALASARSPLLISRTIALATSSEVQSSTDWRAVFSKLGTHPNGVRALWDWLRGNWESVVEGKGIMGGMVVGICVRGFATWAQEREVRRWFEGVDTKVSFFLICTRWVGRRMS
jgi:aminopeptidase 2